MFRRTCPKCKIEKEEIEFCKCKSTKSGLQVYCKPCSKIIRTIRKEKLKIYHRGYYLKNRDKVSENYLNNRKKYLNKAKQYREEHPEIIKKYREEHRTEILEKLRNYNMKNKGKIKLMYLTPRGVYIRLKTTSKFRNIELAISEKDFINWYDNQEKKCHYCNRTLEEIKQDNREQDKHKTKMSIDRKDNDRGYITDNIVLACTRCNLIKGNYFTEQEMLKIGKILKIIFEDK